MINRREMLIGMSVATLGAAVPSASALVEVLEPRLHGMQGPASGGQTGVAANDAVDERLRKDLARLTSRANSEEGVPVFLGCMNLVVDKSHKAPATQLTSLNRAVTAEFRQTVAAWERIRPNAPASDVAEVIVVLADRDFSNGGTEQTS